MIIWFIVGFIVWAMCILYMLSIFKGGNISRGYEQKPHYRHMVNTQKIRNFTKCSDERDNCISFI